MKTYSEALEKLNGRDRRKIDNNTYLEKRAEDIAVKLHETDILTFKKSNDVVFNSGGWRTLTTKDRMNKYSPCAINQKNGQWYIDGKLYNDGVVYHSGKIKGALPLKDVKKRDNLKKEAKKYIDAYWQAFKQGEIPAPSNGDCWHCVLRVSDPSADAGKTLGEVVKNSDHMHDHIKEGYFVPSMIVRASEVFRVSPTAKNVFAYRWNPEYQDKNNEFVWEIAELQLKSALYRFVKRSLGFAV